jgi:hypothetical protein
VQPDVFEFADFELDLTRFELRRKGKVLKLEKLPMELLILLASRKGAWFLVKKSSRDFGVRKCSWIPSMGSTLPSARSGGHSKTTRRSLGSSRR